MSMSRRSALALVLANGLSWSPVLAAERSAFDPAAFEAAQRAGRPILVEVTAPWCPVCFVQGFTLRALANDQRFKDLIVFVVDFDSQKPYLRKGVSI